MNKDLENFDWVFYLNYYEDLRLAGLKTEEDAKKHYINHGQFENRIFYDYLKTKVNLHGHILMTSL